MLIPPSERILKDNSEEHPSDVIFPICYDMHSSPSSILVMTTGALSILVL